MDQKKTFKAGETIACEGEQGNEAYKIVSGFVTITQKKNGDNVYIRQCGPGQIIGEMALLEDRPRSATITAATDTQVQVISDTLLSRELEKMPPVITDLIVELCDRIKEKDKDWMGVVGKAKGLTEASPVDLVAQTDEALAVLGSQTVQITEYPCRIGRPSKTFFAQHVHRNTIELDDKTHNQISRSHATLDFSNDTYVVIDRNSKYGLTVNGKRIGGEDPKSWAILNRGDNELILGNAQSPFKFIIRV